MATSISITKTARSSANHLSLTTRENEVLDVTVVLLDGGYASTAIGPIEIFHSAGALWNSLQGAAAAPRFRVRCATIDGRSISSVCSLMLTPEFSIDDITHTDIIILAASSLELQERIAFNTPLLTWLREWHEKGAYIAGVCSSALYLAEAGLLDGKEATTHWALAEEMIERYPAVNWKPEQFVTEDDRLLCSGGVYASFDISLYLVEKFCGHEVALQCAKSLLISMPRSKQSGYSATPMSRPHSDDKIRDTEEFLRQHFASDVPIEMLAERVGMGQRNFIRRFKAATGRLPGGYVQTLRIASAKEMLERGADSIQQVCIRNGYEDIAFFRTLFKRHTGMTPAEYRSRFAAMSLNRGELVPGRSVA
ncbi:MAG: helix-turn-helix domain-containing protein [Gemmatimonadaceae bacterium]